MSLVYVILLSTVLLMGISAVWALVWAVKTGQFRNFQRGAVSIFDPDEPLGTVTDHFPGEKTVEEAKPDDHVDDETEEGKAPRHTPVNRMKEHFGEEWPDGDIR